MSFYNSKYANAILTSSPVLTNITNDTVELMQDIYDLKDEEDTNVLNSKILDMMLDKKMVKYETVEKLYETGKINFDGIEAILERYKES